MKKLWLKENFNNTTHENLSELKSGYEEGMCDLLKLISY